MIPKVSSWKKDTLASLTEMLNKGGTLAVIDIHGVPADAMLGMRAGLRSNMNIQVAKKRLMKLAWEASGNDFSDLEELYKSAVQPALVQTDMNSFGELNSVGIPAKIMKGSVQIQKKVTVLNEGEVFEGDLGMMLSKIGINPIVTGLRLCGTIEEGTRFEPATLDIDYEQFESDLISFGAGAYNLACNIRWFTTQTTPTLLSKASSEALSVALEAAIVTTETLPHLIGRANRGAMGVAGALSPDALDEELSQLLGAAASAAASAAVEETSTDEAPAEAEEEEEEEEEGGFEGLGSLFG